MRLLVVDDVFVAQSSSRRCLSQSFGTPSFAEAFPSRAEFRGSSSSKALVSESRISFPHRRKSVIRHGFLSSIACLLMLHLTFLSAMRAERATQLQQ